MKEMVYQVDHKREVLYDGVYEGHKFAILSLGTHPTAYVECKLEDCYSCEDERLDDIKVHGGFTYFDKTRWGEPDDIYYLGWDYAHYMDYAGYEEIYPLECRTNGRKWTTKEIFEEVKSVIEQLTKVEFEQKADSKA